MSIKKIDHKQKKSEPFEKISSKEIERETRTHKRIDKVWIFLDLKCCAVTPTFFYFAIGVKGWAWTGVEAHILEPEFWKECILFCNPQVPYFFNIIGEDRLY